MDASRQAIIDTASDWFVRTRDRELSRAERREFVRWLRESPVHVLEYLAIARLWGDVAELDGLSADGSSPLIADNVVDLGARAESGGPMEATETATRQAPVSQWGSPRPLSVAASLLAVAFLGVTGWWLADSSLQSHVTVRGEQRSLVLDDGTLVEMNTSSEIRVDYDSSARYVTLVQGEVFFDVREDAARPFVVRAGESEIRVHGTRFNVYMHARETTVTVLEGNVTVFTALLSGDDPEAAGAVVEFDPSGRPGGESVRLVGGEQAVIDNETRQIATAALTDPEQAPAWTDRRLVFNESPLDQILAEFSRYNEFDYAISSEDVGTLKFTGVFDTQDPESFISYLEFYSEVSVTRSNGVVVVSSPP